MPDLHAGNQYPVGAAFLAQGKVYPALIGSDIGCGMTFFRLSGLRRNQLEGREQQVAEQLHNLEGPWDGDPSAALREAGVTSHLAHSFARLLGTVGRGNHFAELQVVDDLRDGAAFANLGMAETEAYLLVHSGSRGFGKAVLERFVEQNGANAGLEEGTPAFLEYMRQHDEALLWARCNRDAIASRVFESLGLSPSEQAKIIDIWHNNVCRKELPSTGEVLLLHRKGAAPSDQGALVIPGSRGTLTYVAVPAGDQENNAFSVAHGAGRAMSRSKARAYLAPPSSATEGNSSTSYGRWALTARRNVYGGVVVCDDKDLLCEEAPEAYKAVDDVVLDLETAGAIRVVATMRPLVTYKVGPLAQCSRLHGALLDGGQNRQRWCGYPN